MSEPIECIAYGWQRPKAREYIDPRTGDTVKIEYHDYNYVWWWGTDRQFNSRIVTEAEEAPKLKLATNLPFVVEKATETELQVAYER